MNHLWAPAVAVIAILGLVPVLRDLRRGLAGTALAPAWNWAAAVWLVWLAANLLRLVPTVPRGVTDIAWYTAAVFALTPPIAVLGARRPTSRVWTWFVLLPLILVFAWPIFPALRHTGTSAAFTLEEPLLAGYVLVLVMGTGNYLGLRNSLPAILWAAGLLLVVLPLCPATAGWGPDAGNSRLGGTFCLVATGWLADRLAVRRHRLRDTRHPVDRVWDDFRNLFGIVWSRRVQERFNDEARRTGLALRLGFDGLERAAGIPGEAFDPQSLAAAEKSLRWLLQKFADPGWIDARLGEGRAPAEWSRDE